MDRIIDVLNREPILVRTVIGAAVTLLVQLGLPVDQGVANALTALVVAVLAVSARSKVTPL